METEQYLELLYSIDQPILLERGNLVNTFGECTIVTHEGVSYEPGGDHVVLLGPFMITQSQFDEIQASMGKELEEVPEEFPNGIDEDNYYEAASMIKAGCKAGVQYYRLNIIGWSYYEGDYFESLETAENEFLQFIIGNSGRPNFERWTDMHPDELEYWCVELGLIKKSIE